MKQDLMTKAKQIITEMSPNNLFLFGIHDPGFKQRFEEAYKELRNDYLFEAREMLDTLRNQLTADEFDAISNYKTQLRDQRYHCCDMELKQHNNGELFVKCNTNVRHRNVDIIHFFEDINRDQSYLLKINDMLVRSGADNIRVMLPLMPDQREDKKDEGKVPISARAIFNQIERSCKDKLERIVTVDLHAAQAQGFSDGPVEHLSAINLFARYVLSDRFVDVLKEGRKYGRNEAGIPMSQLVTIVSPDVGGVKRAKRLADLLDSNYFIVDKERTGHGESEAKGSVGEIKTPYAIIVDDLISTGGTIKEAARDIKKKYKLKQVFVFGTHGEFCAKRDKNDYNNILSLAEGILRASGAKVVVTDTIPRSNSYYIENNDWLPDVISMARPLANIALTNRLGFSVSQLLGRLDSEVKQYAKSGECMSIDKYLVKTD